MDTQSTSQPLQNTSQQSGASPTLQGVFTLPVAPTRGFIGRAAELNSLLQILAAPNEAHLISITGKEGNGKSTLASEAARYLVRDGIYTQCAYYDFAGGGGVNAALWGLSCLLPYKADPHADNTAAIKQLLADSPVLLIWDHLEALLPEGDAPLLETRFRLLIQTGAELVAGTKSKLVIISTNPLPGFSALPSGISFPELGPLSDADALSLLQAARPPTLAENELPKILGYCFNQPVAILTLAAILHHLTPETLYEIVEQVMPGVTASGIWNGQQAHELALGTIWQMLKPDVRESFYGLGVFATGGMEGLVNQVGQQDSESWQRFQSLTIQGGLVYQEQVPPLTIPYLHFNPTLVHYTHRHLSHDTAMRRSAWHCASYLGLLKWIRDQEQRIGKSLQQLLWVEMPNFRRAFTTLASSGELSYAHEFSQVFTYALDKFGLQDEIDLVNEIIRSLMQSALPKEGPLQRVGVLFILDQVQELLDSGKSQQALSILQPFCQRLDKDDQLAYKGDEAAFDRARAYHLLGKIFLAVNRGPAALSAMLYALSLYDQLADQSATRPELLQLLLDLTDLLLTAKEIEQAKKTAERALLIAADLQDKAASGKLNQRMALITQLQGDLDLSQQYASQALACYAAINDAEGQAEALRQLAGLYMQQNKPDEAIQQLDDAVVFARQADKKMLEADILVRLGSLNAQQEHLQEAKDDYFLALRIFQDHQFKPAQMSTEVLLSELLLRTEDTANARIHAEAARALVDGSGPGAQPWAIFDLLERIAVAEGDTERAKMWRRRTRESFADAPQAEPLLMRWRPILLKLAAACNGEALDEDTVATLEKMEAETNKPEFFDTIWRVLGGERGSELYEPLDIAEAVIIKRLLDGIEHPESLTNAPNAGTQQRQLPNFSEEQFIVAVKAALRGDAQAISITESFIQMLEGNQAPQTLHDLAHALRRVLAGERDESIADGLSEEFSHLIHTLIAALGEGNS